MILRLNFFLNLGQECMELMRCQMITQNLLRCAQCESITHYYVVGMTHNYVVPLTIHPNMLGVWSMAVLLRQPLEYYLLHSKE